MTDSLRHVVEERDPPDAMSQNCLQRIVHLPSTDFKDDKLAAWLSRQAEELLSASKLNNAHHVAVSESYNTGLGTNSPTVK